MDRINLESRSESTISKALYGMTKYDPDALRDAVDEAVGTDAENACSYTYHCQQIIQDYEREYGDDADGANGTTYSAGQWQEAMVAYANGIAYSAMSSMCAEALAEIEEAADEIAELAGCDATDLAIGADCPHGWAPHDREDEQGTHFWEPAELEGCKAIAREVRGVWLSYTWTPGV